MKVRVGFVSNSSSCSYVAIGVQLTHDDLNILSNHFDFKDNDSLGNRLRKDYNVQTCQVVESYDEDGETVIFATVVGWQVWIGDENGALKKNIAPIFNDVVQDMFKMDKLIDSFSQREVKIISDTYGC